MRGFPIRTSSDHGSFANSPRLIAGYNVLLRLLVPRHPPCALINLTTKIIHKRCSRPLCSSQATTGPSTLTPAPTPTQPPCGTRARAVRPSGTSPQSLEPGHHPQAATRLVATLNEQPSGCSLRTQQRARPTPSPAADRSHPNPQGSYGVLGATSSKAGHSRCSTLEHRPPLVRQGQRAWTPSPHPMTGTASARCSLERR